MIKDLKLRATINTMKIKKTLIFPFLISVAQVYAMNNLKEEDYPYYHENKKFYHIYRKEFFEKLRTLDENKIKGMLKKYPEMAHTKCEFGDKNITIDYHPLSYLISLNNENDTKVISIAKIIINATHDNKILYNSFSHIIGNICASCYRVNKQSLKICEKILERKNYLLKFGSLSENDLEMKFLYELDYFLNRLKNTTDENKRLFELLNKHYQEKQNL